MKHRTAWFLGVAAFLLTGVSTNAQGRFEVTPFIGYETSGTYPLSNPGGSLALVDHLRVNDALSYGSFLDYNLTENGQLEFMWDRNNTSYSARDITTLQYFKAYNSDVDQFQFGGLYMFRGSEHRLRPYVAASLGFTHDSNSPISMGFTSVSNRTAFAWSIGGGVKYYLNRHVGFRGDVRYLPTYGSSSDQTYCYFGCYVARVPNYLNRGNFVGGLIFRF
ncbi:MAG TPA: OmpA family protein [Candidatus Acidoferrum sp.]|nr:OmpA family protein [Candidatus Acidoferrum sp.]